MSALPFPTGRSSSVGARPGLTPRLGVRSGPACEPSLGRRTELVACCDALRSRLMADSPVNDSPRWCGLRSDRSTGLRAASHPASTLPGGVIPAGGTLLSVVGRTAGVLSVAAVRAVSVSATESQATQQPRDRWQSGRATIECQPRWIDLVPRTITTGSTTAWRSRAPRPSAKSATARTTVACSPSILSHINQKGIDRSDRRYT
jgi:hypothetical protein